ncbi:MAG: hypothetical protein RJA44_1919 [Pseudomonadota bacterium]
MKRKLIVTLVAAALELYAATAGAQATCNIAGTANSASGATPVTTGPLNPVDGFPEYVTDSTGVTVQRCLDPLVCFFDPIVPTDPFSLQIGSGGEAFYWGADAILTNPAGHATLKLVMAAETAFLQAGPNGEPINGSQFPFLRIRVVLDAPADGIYTLEHPYGAEKFEVVGATGNRDIFFTVDSGFAPNSTVTGKVGPFLKSTAAPVGFMGDANGLPTTVTGSPCGRNSVRLTGVTPTGAAIDFGGVTELVTNAFTVQGRLYDGKVQTPLNSTRLTYTRDASGAGQIDAFGASMATAALTVKDGPTIPAASSRIAAPVALDRTAITPTDAVNSTSVVVDANVVPPIVQLTAASPTTDTTSLNLKLLDLVDISQADYDPATGVLSVSAASSDQLQAPALTLRDFGPFTVGSPIKTVTTVAPPGVVHVDSAAGGSATALVRVVSSAPPSAPTGLAGTALSSTSVALNWTDTSGNENGFTIYSVDAAGKLTQVGSASQNATTYTVSGLTAATAYTFQVFAVNGAGSSGSNTFTVDTLPLPLAPSAVTPSLSATPGSIVVNWADNSSDETGFAVSRATVTAGTVGAFTTLATLAAGSTTYTDAGRAANTTYVYRVVAVRGTDSSVAALSANFLTPSLPATPAAPTATVSGNSVALSWSDIANETGYQVYRRTGAGAFAAVSAVLPADTTSYGEAGLANATYNYRIQASNWAGTVQSANSASVVVNSVTLNAAANVQASTANSPVVTWVDQSSGETAYRVRRTPQTVNGTTGRVTAGTTTTNLISNLAANSTTFTDVNAIRDAMYIYSVAAMNGTTQGPLASSGYVIAANGGLATANRPTATRVNGVARVNLTWTAVTAASVGGYQVERCVSTGPTSTTCAAGSTFEKVTGTAVNTAGTVDGRNTTGFADTTVARNTNYVYRLRTVGGAGTGLLGNTVSLTRAVSTN